MTATVEIRPRLTRTRNGSTRGEIFRNNHCPAGVNAALATTRAYKPSREAMRAMLKECLVYDPAIITDELVEARLATSTAPGVQEQFEAMFSGGGVVTDNVVKLNRGDSNVPSSNFGDRE